jgi:ribonucleotide reductase alpha subunit
LIECAARRQKWLDMSQALTLYTADLDPAALAEMCMQAWEKGLKTTRQLHSPVRPPQLKAQSKRERQGESISPPPLRAEPEPVAIK